MMHIGIDGNEANVVDRVGSNQYAYGILKAMYETTRRSGEAAIRFTVYLKSEPVWDMPNER